MIECDLNSKSDISEVRKWLYDNYLLTLIDEVFINTAKDMFCVDNEGYYVKIRISNLKQGKSYSVFSKSNPYTLYNIKLWIKNNGNRIDILDDVYVNNSTHIRSKCKTCSYEWGISWSSMRIKNGCPKCSGVLKNNLLNIKNILNKISPNIEILSEEYINAHSKLHCRCKIDGNEWNAKWHHLKNGHGCIVCHHRNAEHIGYYNETNANRNKDKWDKIKANVYLIKLYDKNEEFYKIGITNRNINKRFRKTLPYDYKEMSVIETNLYDAIIIEKKLHDINREYKYIPKLKFDGYTECFSEVKDLCLTVEM